MAIKGVIQIDELSKTVLGHLKEYNKEIAEGVEIAAEKNAKLGVKLLKSNSPKDTGDYAKGWREKKVPKRGRVIHNATDYRLTHLLENGHATADGTDVVPPKVHIKPVEDYLIETFTEDIEELVGGKK